MVFTILGTVADHRGNEWMKGDQPGDGVWPSWGWWVSIIGIIGDSPWDGG